MRFVFLFMALIALATTASAAPKKAAKKLPEYSGPAGLTWGMSPDEVKAKLSDKFEFVEEVEGDGGATFEQHYRGEFAGFSTRIVAPSFFEGKLIGFNVVLHRKLEVPLSLLWKRAVETVEKRYGKPAQIHAPPKTPSAVLAETARSAATKNAVRRLAAVEDEHSWLDAKIRSEEWVPVAGWKFANAGLMVFVMNEEVVWMFIHGESYARWQKATEEEPDF